jgi:hypothetical protein
MNCEGGRAVPCAASESEKRISSHGSSTAVWGAAVASLLLVIPGLLGCKSVLVSTYISPRVTGRVLAADTRQPISKVEVKRVSAPANQNYDDPAKGGRRMDALSGTRTDSQGAFVLDAEKDLTLLRQQVWYSVTVAFQREGYLTLRTNFTVTQATNAPNGTPVVNAGDILLHPVSQ